MTYIILAAGKGQNLQPLTMNYPKTLYKLDDKTTILHHIVRTIKKYDKGAEIVIAVGYLGNMISEALIDENVKIVRNPFYETTNSIASVWFAKDYLERDNVTIIHGDVIFDDYIVENYLIPKTNHPFSLVDKSVVKHGAYNAVTKDGQILVMSQKLENFDAKYACATKLDAVSARLIKKEIDIMINNNMYSLFFEDVMIQMVLFNNFQLGYIDIAGHAWSEVDGVDDFLMAQSIHKRSRIGKG